MAEFLRIKPLVPSTLWRLWQRLNEALPDIRPVWHTRLSTFIELDEAEEQYGASHGPDIKGFILDTSVDLVLAARTMISGRYPDYLPFAAFDINFDGRKLDLFRELGISYERAPEMKALLNDSNFLSVDMPALRQRSENPPRSNVLKPLLRGDQSWAIEVATKLAKRGQVFSEVGLSSFVDVDSLSEISREDRNFLHRTTVDALICTPPPMAVPLFVIEWDGKEHQKEKKKRNDRRKDRVLHRAGLNGLRITTDDLPAPGRRRRGGSQSVVNSILRTFVDRASRKQGDSWWHVEQLQAALLWKVAHVPEEGLRHDLSGLLKKLAPLTRRRARSDAAAIRETTRALISGQESESPPPDWWGNEKTDVTLDQWYEEEEALVLADAIDRNALRGEDLDSCLCRYFFLHQDGWDNARGATQYWRVLKPGEFLQLGGYVNEVTSRSPRLVGAPIREALIYAP